MFFAEIFVKIRILELPHNNLSRYIESRVNGYLRREMQTGKYGNDDYEVVIRTLSVCDKEMEVKPLMRQK